MLVDMMVMVLTLLEPWRYVDDPDGPVIVLLMVLMEMELLLMMQLGDALMMLVDDAAPGDRGAHVVIGPVEMMMI